MLAALSLVITSLKSPTRGMWFFLVLPITLPELDTTTAVFHTVPPWVSSLSRMGDTITMLYFLAICNIGDGEELVKIFNTVPY